MDTRWLVVILVAGCGAGEVLEPSPELVFPEEPRCLSCDVTAEQGEIEVGEPAPDVRATPEELLFYPTHGAADEHDPGMVTVTNRYPFLVFVTRARIDDDTSAGNPTGGSHYFVVDAVTEWIELPPAGEAQLPVWFVGSERQQSAWLHIFTTASEQRRLEVALTGKTMFQ